MQFNKPTIAKAALLSFMVGLMAMAGIGCSSDKGTGSSRIPTDEITVNLSRISVTYDCDADASLGGPGEFNYSFKVQVENDQGSWETVKSFSERETKINSGDTKDITDRVATFTVPRISNQKFRVYITMREVDGSSDDFSTSRTVVHEYVDGQEKLWDPTPGYTSYSKTSQTGSVNWTLDLRDRKTVLGVVTREGCYLGVRYDVSIKSID